MRLARTIDQIKATASAFSEDKVPRLASSIAYATIFALAPLLIVLIAILGLILGSHTNVENSLIAQISAHAGPQAGATVREVVAAQFNRPRQGILAQVIGWVVFAVGASGLFGSLQDALNTIWNVERIKASWKEVVRDRVVSFGMLAVLGFVLLVSFGANAAIAFVSSHYMATLTFPGAAAVLGIVNVLVNIAVTSATLTALYKLLPDVSIRWKDAWVGGITTAVLFIIGEALLTIYMAKAGIASGYGAAGSLLVILVWIYYSAMMLLLGAEFMKVRASDPKTKVPSVIRGATDVPAGVDPRR